MVDDGRMIEKRRCKAMIDEGIYDPESQEGIDFCVNYCPYEYCVVVENRLSDKQIRKRENTILARELRKHRVSVDDIALVLGISARSVRRYLKK